MDGLTWFWTIVVFLLTWGIPIALFIYNPHVDRSHNTVYDDIPYDKYKFRRPSEILVFFGILYGILYGIYFAQKYGLLVWL